MLEPMHEQCIHDLNALMDDDISLIAKEVISCLQTTDAAVDVWTFADMERDS